MRAELTEEEKEARRVYYRKYYAEHKREISTNAFYRYHSDLEKARANARRWQLKYRENNKERLREYHREYYRTHREQISITRYAWRCKRKRNQLNNEE